MKKQLIFFLLIWLAGCVAVNAQIPTAKEARKHPYEARVKDSLLNIQIKRIQVQSSIKMAMDEGKDSASVWMMDSGFLKELKNKGYTVKLINEDFNYWRIYW